MNTFIGALLAALLLMPFRADAGCIQWRWDELAPGKVNTIPVLGYVVFQNDGTPFPKPLGNNPLPTRTWTECGIEGEQISIEVMALGSMSGGWVGIKTSKHSLPSDEHAFPPSGITKVVHLTP